MIAKKEALARRAKKLRKRMLDQGKISLVVHRTSQHIYAQIISDDRTRVLTSASTLDKDLKKEATGNIAAAEKVGELIAKRAKKVGVESVTFDRSGFRFHGRVKALAESARKQGLKF